MKRLKIKVNTEYQRLVPPLSKDEYDSLKDSLAKYGTLVPISYNKDGEILDGHTRYKIANDLKISVKMNENL